MKLMHSTCAGWSHGCCWKNAGAFVVAAGRVTPNAELELVVHPAQSVTNDPKSPAPIHTGTSSGVPSAATSGGDANAPPANSAGIESAITCASGRCGAASNTSSANRADTGCPPPGVISASVVGFGSPADVASLAHSASAPLVPAPPVSVPALTNAIACPSAPRLPGLPRLRPPKQYMRAGWSHAIGGSSEVHSPNPPATEPAASGELSDVDENCSHASFAAAVPSGLVFVTTTVSSPTSRPIRRRGSARDVAGRELGQEREHERAVGAAEVRRRELAAALVRDARGGRGVGARQVRDERVRAARQAGAAGELVAQRVGGGAAVEAARRLLRRRHEHEVRRAIEVAREHRDVTAAGQRAARAGRAVARAAGREEAGEHVVADRRRRVQRDRRARRERRVARARARDPRRRRRDRAAAGAGAAGDDVHGQRDRRVARRCVDRPRGVRAFPRRRQPERVPTRAGSQRRRDPRRGHGYRSRHPARHVHVRVPSRGIQRT